MSFDSPRVAGVRRMRAAGAGAGLCVGRTISSQEINGEKHMKPSTKNKIKGNVHAEKGSVKEQAGQIANNPNLAAEGQDEALAGKVQKKVGQVQKVFGK